MKGESFTFLTSSGEDVWKAMGIVEVMQKTNQPVPPQVQVKASLQECLRKRMSSRRPHCLFLLKSRYSLSVRMSGNRMSSRRPTCLSLLKSR
jgi:hypothetical protein